MRHYQPWAIAISLSLLTLAGCGGGSDDTVATTPAPTPSVSIADYVVPRAPSCASGDTPETALQGQVPAALRQSGFGGFSCNLKLVSQLPGRRCIVVRCDLYRQEGPDLLLSRNDGR